MACVGPGESRVLPGLKPIKGDVAVVKMDCDANKFRFMASLRKPSEATTERIYKLNALGIETNAFDFFKIQLDNVTISALSLPVYPVLRLLRSRLSCV